MKKLIKGIVDFRKTKQINYCNKFSSLSMRQSPDALLVACSDSRVVPNLFASTDPGDLFVLRNIGNLIPPYESNKNLTNETSVASAIEFSLLSLNVSDIIICGHSECGAMQSLLDNNFKKNLNFCKKWLENAMPSYDRFRTARPQNNLSQCNLLSRINVLQQLEHLKTYPVVLQRLQAGQLRIHGWWFDLTTADVLYYNNDHKDFIVIDEDEAKKILATL